MDAVHFGGSGSFVNIAQDAGMAGFEAIGLVLGLAHSVTRDRVGFHFSIPSYIVE